MAEVTVRAAQRALAALAVPRPWEVGSPKWHATAYEPVGRLAALAAAAAAGGDGADAALADALAADPCRIDALVGALLAAEAWREELLPGIAARLLLGEGAVSGNSDAASTMQSEVSQALKQHAVLTLYFPLFHEGEAANALQLLAYSEAFADALAARDCAVDVVDYAVRRLTALGAAAHVHNALAPADRARGVAARFKAAGAGAASGSSHLQALPRHGALDPDTALALVLAVAEAAEGGAAGTVDVAALAPRVAAFLDIYYGSWGPGGGNGGSGGGPAPDESHAARLGRWAADARFATGAAATSLLRFLSDRVGAPLPLAVLARLLDTHDLPVALVPLIHNPPGVRRHEPDGDGDVDGGRGWEKWGAGGSWAPVDAAGPGGLLRLTPLEAAPWLTLYNLTSDPGAVRHYALTPARKAALLRVRRYLTPGLVDQVPPLAGLQRYLDELALVAVPDGSGGSGASSKAGLLLQAVPAVREALLDAGRTPPPGWRRQRQRPSQGSGAGAPAAPPTTSSAAVGASGGGHSEPAAAGGALATGTTTATSTQHASSALLSLEGRLADAAAGGGPTSAGNGAGSGGLSALLTVVKPAPPEPQLLPPGGARGLAASPLPSAPKVDDGGVGDGRWSWDEAAEWCAQQLLQEAAAAAAAAQWGSGGSGGATATTTSTPADDADIVVDDDDDALLAALAGPPRCEVCGVSGPAVKRCARCRNAWYCGRACQAAAWRAGHAALCDVVAKHGGGGGGGGGGGRWR